MTMPPRKQNKGQARKAKAASAPLRQQQHQQQANQRLDSLSTNLLLADMRCKHGYPPLSLGHVCLTFIKVFSDEWAKQADDHGTNMACFYAMQSSHEKYPEV